LSFTWIS